MTVKNRWKIAAAAVPPFGLDGLFEQTQESSDRWASGPLRGHPVTRYIHRAWQDVDEEVLAMHPALRGGGRGVRRAVMALTEWPEPATTRANPAPLAAGLCADLNGDKKAQKRAWVALELLAASPGDDVATLIDVVVDNLATVDKPAELAKHLRWLGAVAWGPSARVGDVTHALASSTTDAVRAQRGSAHHHMHEAP